MLDTTLTMAAEVIDSEKQDSGTVREPISRGAMDTRTARLVIAENSIESVRLGFRLRLVLVSDIGRRVSLACLLLAENFRVLFSMFCSLR